MQTLPQEVLLHPFCLWVQKVQTNSFAQDRVWVCPPPHGIPTTEPAFIEWQSTIHRYLPPSKLVGQSTKATAKVTLTSHQLINLRTKKAHLFVQTAEQSPPPCLLATLLSLEPEVQNAEIVKPLPQYLDWERFKTSLLGSLSQFLMPPIFTKGEITFLLFSAGLVRLSCSRKRTKNKIVKQ